MAHPVPGRLHLLLCHLGTGESKTPLESRRACLSDGRARGRIDRSRWAVSTQRGVRDPRRMCERPLSGEVGMSNTTSISQFPVP